MVSRLASLALILVIGGSVFAGIPLHSNEQECGMREMAGMDCCKKAAQAGTITSEISTARLCCGLGCSQSGTPGSTGNKLPRPSTSQSFSIHQLFVQPSVVSPQLSLRSRWSDSPPPYSNPAYIRHLALLI